MFDYAGVPNMGNSQLFDTQQCSLVDIIHFSNTILLESSVGLVGSIGVGKQPCHHLIDDHLF